YARLVYDHWQRRQLIEFGEDVVGTAYRAELDNPASAQIERAESWLYRLAESGDTGSGFQPLSAATGRAIEIADAAYKRGARTVGTPTGFTEVDKMLGGLHRSDLVVLAGRPSMGKTALATNIGFNAAQNGETVGFFSLEMANEQLGARVLGGESRIPADWVRRGDLNQQHFNQLIEAKRRTDGLPLWIDDTPALTVAALRESGSIEQDADVVIFVYREEYYLREPAVEDAVKWSQWREKLNAVHDKAELIVAKHRHGQTGSVRLHFDRDTTRFSNLATT